MTSAWRGPVVVGGSGGSGTRALAAVLRELGVFLGGELNPELDSIPIGLYDIEWGPRYLATGGAPARMKLDFAAALLRHMRPIPRVGSAWGWKHPQSYLQLPLIARRFPRLRFIHVVRDGRDMALSDNRNQLDLYGPAVFGREPQATPQEMVGFWSWANLRVAQQGERLGGRYLAVRLEDLCADPAREVARISAFAGCAGSIDAALDSVQAPASLGRWRALPQASIDQLEAIGAPALRRFGYLSG